ncbi:CpaF family protein [Alicyclobacillus sp. SO9]|uniref:CpaF family protein n=1 Tax=Alicyclobacillus sp. SO9 TaxID=2665646 RepID=UPI0018E88198|nr:CpaF family protein [Alicyclobacillus sp. SO9]QQE79453.1 CpaF family protein [Alicyclobacillus sp. SO9]
MSLLRRLEQRKSAAEENPEAQKRTIAVFTPSDKKNADEKYTARDSEDIFTRWKILLHQKLVQELFDEEADDELETVIQRLIETEDPPLPKHERDRMIRELAAEANGYGPIDALLKDESVSEVMVNGPKQVYVERHGKLVHTPVTFLNDDHVMRVIERIVSPLGRRIDESSPMVDARLPDGSRVNAIIPPLAVSGPTVTIRKFAKDPYQVADLIGFDTLTDQMAEFLEACVSARLNIVVSGGTGSGKSTTLNVVSSFIPSTERVVTIEDAAELQLHQSHVVTLETRPPNVEGKGAILIRDLVKNSLRMRPDRIVVGEVRGGEALDMLQAMNTGHDGSLTTVHANSPRDCLRRLEVMVLMAGMDLPLRAIREQVASAVDVVVQQARLRDGSRKIVQISEVMGMEGDNIVLQDLFTFKEHGKMEDGRVQGKHIPTGVVPSFLERLQDQGFAVNYSWFQPGEAGW